MDQIAIPLEQEMGSGMRYKKWGHKKWGHKKWGQACVIALMYASSLSRNMPELFALVSIFPICRLNVEGSR